METQKENMTYIYIGILFVIIIMFMMRPLKFYKINCNHKQRNIKNRRNGIISL